MLSRICVSTLFTFLIAGTSFLISAAQAQDDAIDSNLTVAVLQDDEVPPDEPNMKPFAEPADNEKRFVITLPHKERGDEDDFKVELIVGKTVMTDGVNRTFMAAQIEEKTVEGWGYPFYNVSGSGEIASTLMAAIPPRPPVEKFVTGQPLLIRYNSRIPIVVYAPKNLEIRYRIWSVSGEAEPAEPK